MKIKDLFKLRDFSNDAIKDPETEKRYTFSDPPDWFIKWVTEGFSGVESFSTETALKISAFYSCVSILSADIGILPFHIMRRDNTGKRLITYDHPQYNLIHNAPNPFTTAITFRESMMAWTLIKGNGYAVIELDRNFQPQALYIQDSDNVTPFLWDPKDGKGKRLFYQIKGINRIFADYEILHIPGLGFDGITGKSITQYARENLQFSANTQKLGNSMMKNSAKVQGVFEVEGILDQPNKDRLQESWAEYQGPDKAGGTPVLPRGIKFKPIQMNNDDLQFIQIKEIQVTDIARWFRMPPHMIGQMANATFSNIEHQSIEYVTRTLMNWIVRNEQEYNKKILGGQPGYYTKMNVGMMLRGDSAARANFYKNMFEIGAFSPNDILELEDMNGYEGGNQHYINGAYVPAEQMAELTSARIMQTLAKTGGQGARSDDQGAGSPGGEHIGGAPGIGARILNGNGIKN